MTQFNVPEGIVVLHALGRHVPLAQVLQVELRNAWPVVQNLQVALVVSEVQADLDGLRPGIEGVQNDLFRHVVHRWDESGCPDRILQRLIFDLLNTGCIFSQIFPQHLHKSTDTFSVQIRNYLQNQFNSRQNAL